MTQERFGGDWDRQVFFKPGAEALPVSNWRPPALNTLPSWADAKRVSIDIETRDEDLKRLGPGCFRDPRKNYIVGIGFAIEDGVKHYLPMRHHDGDNCPEGPEAVRAYVRDQLRDFKGHILGAKLDYDAAWLEQEGIPVLGHPLMDVQIADPLIWELHDRYSLETLCERHGLPGKDETILRQAAAAYRVDPKAGLWKIAARFVGPYGETDALRPIQIMRRQEVLIEAEEIDSIWKLEQKVTPVLVKMFRRGVRVDLKRVEIIERKCREVATEALAQVRALTGVNIKYEDVWKSSVLAHALRIAGYKIPKTDVKISERTGRRSGGNDSVDKEFLDKCGEVGALLHKARDWNKLDTTFAKQIREHAIISGDGEARIHATTNQMKTTDDEGGGKGVRFGRTSMTSPGLQQQPVRHDDFGAMWRSIFVKDRDSAGWACSDWSQQEPRIVVDACEKRNLPGAKEFADAYRADPSMDIHQRLADIVNIPRKIVKNYVNGRIYGMGDLKTCRHIKQPTVRRMVRGEMRDVPGEVGQAMIDKFKEFAPWISEYTREAAKAVKRNGGHVWTYLRRKCHFQPKGPGEWEDEHKAGSRYGQGTAADQAKKTLVAADDEGIPVQLLIHDEFDFSYEDIKQAKRLKELQLTVVTFNVPMLVDLEVGESWGQLEKVKD